jgi:UDP:flavonoid glycosyltransferase YjiC (YdhE family)
MILLPLFWDQHDNAQRMDELGLGIRLAPYEVEPEELHAAIARLLGDSALRGRLDTIGRRLQASPGTARAADVIGAVARDQAPVA